MDYNQKSTASNLQAKVIPDKPVAKTNPLNTEHDYHNVDEMAKDLGVELPDNDKLSMCDRLKSRDKQR